MGIIINDVIFLFCFEKLLHIDLAIINQVFKKSKFVISPNVESLISNIKNRVLISRTIHNIKFIHGF